VHLCYIFRHIAAEDFPWLVFAVNLLLIPANYPHPGAEWSGAQNEHSALALQGIVRHLEVLMPRPYVPRLLAFSDRWRAYATIPRGHIRRGIPVHRPPYMALPGIFRGFWHSQAAFAFSRRLAAALHREVGFDAILSFDLASAGGLAWRLGAALGIPACGWATGSDIRTSAESRVGRGVQQALRRLDLIFYQSSELKGLGAALLGTRAEALPPERHIVQARGVREPETLPDEAVRREIRLRLHLSDEQIVILHLGRIKRGKGLFELVEGFAHWGKGRTDLVLLLVGAIPGYDDAPELEKKIRSLRDLDGRIRVLPACAPHQIWEYFTAADVFAFPSFREGMPNSLLEAMLGGLPAVAFSIPAVQEITRFGRGLVEVRAYDFPSFGEAVVQLAADASLRREIGQQGRAIVRDHFSAQKSMRVVVDHIQRLTVG
jgi:glycosyltransferase involved in cell wall biosynthesis